MSKKNTVVLKIEGTDGETGEPRYRITAEYFGIPKDAELKMQKDIIQKTFEWGDVNVASQQ